MRWLSGTELDWVEHVLPLWTSLSLFYFPLLLSYMALDLEAALYVIFSHEEGCDDLLCHIYRSLAASFVGISILNALFSSNHNRVAER